MKHSHKTEMSPCPFTLLTLSRSLSLCLPYLFLSSSLSFFFRSPFFFFLAHCRLGQGQPASESEVESRQVFVTNNYFPRQASAEHLPEFRPQWQTGLVSLTLQAER